MDTFHHLVKAILVIVILYALAILMRRRGTLTEEDSKILARIVTDLCLPAMIFVTMAGQSIRLGEGFRDVMLVYKLTGLEGRTLGYLNYDICLHAMPIKNSCTVCASSYIAANGNHINFHRNAQAFDRLRSVLQFSASPAWTSFSEPLQIHFVSGRFLSPGTGSIYPFKCLKSRHCERSKGDKIVIPIVRATSFKLITS